MRRRAWGRGQGPSTAAHPCASLGSTDRSTSQQRLNERTNDNAKTERCATRTTCLSNAPGHVTEAQRHAEVPPTRELVAKLGFASGSSAEMSIMEVPRRGEGEERKTLPLDT